MNPILVNLVTFLAGLIIGHWFAIHRDRRKEFNEVTDRIILKLADQAAEPSVYKQVLPDDIYLLGRHFNWWQRKKYNKALDNYEAALSDSNQIENPGKVWAYKNKEMVVTATRELMKLMHRR